jgi:hypothetical protein
MRAFARILPFAFVACSYPDFKFSPPEPPDVEVEDTIEPDSAAPIDSSGSEPDTSVEVDAAMVDPVDAMDAAKPDTFLPDTFKPDTFKPDLGPDVAPSGCAVRHDFCANSDTATSPST